MLKSIERIKGKEKGECLIIGGGPSVKEFDFSKVVDIPKIAVNRYYLPYLLKYQIHTDRFFTKWLKKNPIDYRTTLIGFEKHAVKRTDYYFNWKIITEGFHTGFYALQIAEYLGFEEIYLIGYDYYQKDGQIYYFEDKGDFQISEAERQTMLNVFECGRLFNDFEKVRWKAKVYNCNPKSKLKKFPSKIFEGGK